MKRLLPFLLAAAAAPCAIAQSAPVDPVARSLAATCSNCHGTNGRAKAPMATLAGIPKDLLVLQIKSYRSGEEPATIMHQIAKGYTDRQIETIAAYFAAQKR